MLYQNPLADNILVLSSIFSKNFKSKEGYILLNQRVNLCRNDFLMKTILGLIRGGGPKTSPDNGANKLANRQMYLCACYFISVFNETMGTLKEN